MLIEFTDYCDVTILLDRVELELISKFYAGG